MKKSMLLILSVLLFLVSVGGIQPVYAEEGESSGQETPDTEEITEAKNTEPAEPTEVPENTEPAETPEPVPENTAGTEETVNWTLLYKLEEGLVYQDERALEVTLDQEDSQAVFTLYEDLPVKEGYTPDGWKIYPEDDPEKVMTCAAGASLIPQQLCENGGMIIAEPVYLKLFTVTVIYEFNCTDAQLEEPYAETDRVVFEDQTVNTFDIRLNASAEGKIFRGWTEKDSDILLTEAEMMQELAQRIIAEELAEITLCGVWEDAEPEVREYHVIYRSAVTDCLFTDTETYEWEQGLYTQKNYLPEEEVVISQEVTRDGFILTGWAVSPEDAEAGTVTYHNGDTLGRYFESGEEVLVLYAVWEEPEAVYSLRLHVNAGTVEGSPANKKGVAVKQITASEFDDIVITRNGYDFAGWYAESTLKTPVTAESFAEDPGDMSLYAKWTARKYKIYFDLNDDGKPGAAMVGIEQVSDQEYDAVKEGFIFNRKQKLTPKAKAPGYTFLGWSADPQASSAKYKAGKTYKNYSETGEDTTLYAVWKIKTYKLKIYVKGGKYGDISLFPLPLDPVKIKKGVVNTTFTAEDIDQLLYVSIPMMKSEQYPGFFTRPGYTLEGWYTDKNYKNKLSSEAELLEMKNHTVYAKWAGVQYNLRLDANAADAYFADADGNRTLIAEKQVTYGKKTKVGSIPVRTGYTFLGWSLDPQASGKSDVVYTKDKKYSRFGKEIPVTGDTVVLYAVWQRKKGTLVSGLNYVTFSGEKLAVYKAPSGYALQMLSAGEGQLRNIKSFDDPNLIITAAVNANYFQMRQDTTDPYGTHYGVEQTYNGVDLAPKQSGLICYYQTNDGRTGWIRSDQYFLQNSDVIFACTPYAVLRYNGQNINVRSTAFMYKENTESFQTMVMKINGIWYLAVSRTKTYPRVMMKYAESLNAEDAILMDGGGSAQMMAYTGGVYKDVQYTGRAIPNVFCIAREK